MSFNLISACLVLHRFFCSFRRAAAEAAAAAAAEERERGKKKKEPDIKVRNFNSRLAVVYAKPRAVKIGSTGSWKFSPFVGGKSIWESASLDAIFMSFSLTLIVDFTGVRPLRIGERERRREAKSET